MRGISFRWTGSRAGSPSISSRRRDRQRDGAHRARFPACGRMRDEDGFTLLEVLIAFAVLAVLLVPILQVFGGGLGNAETARAYSTATLLARSKLAEIATESELADGESDGRFEGSNYRWRSTIARDETEVIEPDGKSAGEKPHERKKGSGFADDGGFGSDGRSKTAGRSSFGSSSFGSSSGHQSSFGSSSGRQSSFGSSSGRQSGFGNRATSHLGESSAPAATSGTGGAPGGPGSPTTLGEAAELRPFRITVTVEWGEGRSGGEVTLTSLRSGRAEGQ